MSHPEDQVCPWCQTEIVWDPEIGPESACPHCFNELGGYRSIQLTVKQTGQSIEFDEDDEDDDEAFADYDELDGEELEALDEYEEGVQRVLDRQEEAPECSACHSFMVHAGAHASTEAFEPAVSEVIGAPLLSAGYATQVYVCPSCFKVEHILAEKDRLAMTRLLKQAGSS
ncbi:hypothetical protein SAMN02799630_02397 [Paenibacillus sp. UNCCL117]|uniref:hypothetical protein n=1 Tax=unclassified Paenibacillus TaxID=185978 RepID=UPI00087EF194|nr:MULTISPECIES: hypothetical protein [unclassified Paenibacillus]SDC00340.1 hypothetical protein SAMN04488602_10165 [Paenibacillus sp. cl123]SFW36338.1 hypothetical protein SAMN02799630_02397 [Paenibacillus sp. UNCCL117]